MLIRDMLVWLGTFLTASLLLVLAVRWSLKRVRQRRKERLKDIEVRCGQAPAELDLPLAWKTPPETVAGRDVRWGQNLLWPLPLGIAAAGIMWSATGQPPLNWTAAGISASLACLIFVVVLAWLIVRRETSIPATGRHLALALRCWAVRIAAGIEPRTALAQTARQLQPLDSELAQQLDMASLSKYDIDQAQLALSRIGSGLAKRLASVLTGAVSDPTAELRSLANTVDEYYLHQLLARSRKIEVWLRYPLALCLVPALNLILFSPAITDLFDKFVKLNRPPAQQRQLLEPIPAAPDPAPEEHGPELETNLTGAAIDESPAIAEPATPAAPPN